MLHIASFNYRSCLTVLRQGFNISVGWMCFLPVPKGGGNHPADFSDCLRHPADPRNGNLFLFYFYVRRRPR